MTTNSDHLNPTRRQDFVMLFEVTDGNPNGDPDAGNLPRVDPETMQGLVSDVSLKRRVRNWVDAFKGDQERFKIYVQNKGYALNDLHQRAYDSQGLKSKGTKQDREDVEKARSWMCNNFYDIRTFGAVMTTGVNCGQVRGPIQLTFARSIDPVVPLDLSITRVAVTRPEDAKVEEGDGEGGSKGGKVTEMGRKAIIPYGFYRAHGFYNPTFAKQTNFDKGDLELFWTALQRMWDLDRSSSRGLTACRGLYVFTHEDGLGNAPAHTLFDLIKIDHVNSPRSFDEYRDKITINEAKLPEGTTLTRLVDG